MNIVLLGPQGSGKGTQAEFLEEKFGFHRIEMGKILRSIIDSDNQYAEVVKEHVNKGELVPEEYIRLIAWDYINKHDKAHGFLFDGYPRSLPQYEHLKDMLMKFGKKLDKVLFLRISEEETVRRLSARRTCEKCGEIYNLVTAPPPTPDTCTCGGRLVQRQDDYPEAIAQRLAAYNEKTVPVLEKAREDGILWEIDGEQSIQAIATQIAEGLEKVLEASA